MTTKIYVVLDKSGSMESCLNDTIGGFNSFVREQKNLKSDSAILSLYQFSNEYLICYENKKIEEVESLTTETFVPNGSTALLDAIGRTINSVTANDDDNIIIVIITDGEENASTEFKKSKINEMIQEKKDKGWEFVFLAANQDAIKGAGDLGINQNSALTYSTNASSEAFEVLSSAISRTRSTPVKECKKVNFTPEERSKSLKK